MRLPNIHRYLPFASLALLLFLSLPPALVLAQDPTQEPPPEATGPQFDPRFGVVDSFVDTEAANAAGAGWTRVFFRWDVVQPGGPSDWKPTNVPDTFLNAEIEAGREVVAVLIGTPAWATASGVSTTPPPPEFWGDFVFKIATQYKGRINHWVIWNQPDITDPTSANYTWAGDQEDYYRLLKEAYLKLKAVDPEMQVHVAGLTYTWDQERGDRQYLERLLDVILADPQAADNDYYFDAVTYHVYYNPQQIYQILSDARRILDLRGLTGKAIWLNETNAPPSEDFLEPPAASPPVQITLPEQSAFIIQAFAMALAGGAERIAVNKMRNQPGSVLLNGLLRGDNSRRPAFTAFQTVTTHFAGTQTARRQRVGDINVVTLNRGRQTTTVLWNTTTAPVNFSLPAIASEALLVDEAGNEQPLTAANGVYRIDLPGAVCSAGAACFIGGAPRLVVEAGTPDQRPDLPAPAPATLGLTLTPTPTVTAASLTLAPTSTVTTVPLTVTVAPAPPPTLTPSPGPPTASDPPTRPPQQNEPIPAVDSAAAAEEGPPAAPVALPDPGVGRPAEASAATPSISATLTAIPPVTFSSVMSPRRILLLFVIGVVVFTITYGVQVIIWYRLKR